MPKIWKALLAAFVLVAFGVQAEKANATEGWYGRVDVGYSTNADWQFSSSDPRVREAGIIENHGSYDLDNALMGSGGVGYAFSNGIRLEGELSARNNEFSRYQPSDTDVTALMGNAYYDFNRGGRIEPYVGAGVGSARVSVTNYKADHATAYQAMVGAAIKLTEQLDLDIGYRHFVIPEAHKSRCGEFCYTVEGEYTHDAVTVGLRYQFAGPAAPPAPAPVPVPVPAPVAICPQSDFVVYFEWDHSDLNAQANEVIDSAITRARECNVTAAAIVGHTDTSGSTAYNIALSERRAAVVRDAMVARGLAATLITSEAHGEADLARATADGVREPLNRRTAVTITFH